MSNKLYVIGIGYKPLNKRSHDIVLDADVILASGRLMEIFPSYEEYSAVRHKVMVINRIDEVMEYIRGNRDKQSIALLASGDPMFFGIGRRVVEEFGNEYLEIIPDLSSIQMAFSGIKEPWDDAFLMSLHGGPDPEKRRRLPYEINDIPMLLDRHNKIAILTDKENNPAVIASFLNSSPLAHHSSLSLYVCEKLGYPDEKITEGTPAEIAEKSFPETNVVIIKDQGSRIKGQGPALRFGLTEKELSHSRGLITKDEIRAVTLHKLRLPEKGVFWDIGAGSGSVSVEAARLYPGLKVYAIERDKEQLANIEENMVKFGARNIIIKSGEAPEALRDLPSPDRVFIGGSRGRLPEIIDCIMEKMVKGAIVLNAITLETLNEALPALESNGLGPEVSQISVARSKVQNGQRHMAALNPVFVIKGERK